MAQSVTLAVDGMTCASCVARSERVLRAQGGVLAASVNLALHQAQVVFDAPATADSLAAALTQAGYETRAKPRDLGDMGAPPLPAIWHRAIAALALTLPVFVLEMGAHLWPSLHHARARLISDTVWGGMQILLIGVVLAGPGRGFFAKGLPALWRGAPDMNALVAMGAGAAYAYSVAVVMFGLPQGAVYFETAGVAVSLILLGRAVEAQAKGAAGQAIARLVQLQPLTALRLRDGQASPVPIAGLMPGDHIQIRPGERIAADGVVIDGQSQIDTSLLTGEAMPIAVGAGDAVTGGCVNGAGVLTVQITAIGAGSVLARITQMVAGAQAAKLPVQDRVDRVTLWFVPVVMALSGLTFAFWALAGAGLGPATLHAVSVLVIACPCAMGLAVPMSILVGTGRGAQLGVLFRGGDALQRLSGVRALAFDKTGTLTHGRPRVVAVYDMGGALALAAGVEAASTHPIARAILDYAAAKGVQAAQVQDGVAIAGQGAQGYCDGGLVQVGSAAMMGNLPADMAEFAAKAALDGQGLVFVAQNGHVIGAFAMQDSLKPHAAPALAGLRARGLRLMMLTGDSAAVAQRIGAALGLAPDEISAQMLPEDKARAIAALQGPCAFVGDGINDAPALAMADVGISMGNGSDVAIEAGDVVLMGGDLAGVERAIALSQAVMANIGQNLFWAFAYNAALIPVAMGALVPFGGPALSPMLAALAMATSSVLVMGNALRLRRFDPKSFA